MLQLSHVSKFFGSQTVLEDINLQLDPQSRIGLIGRNGCGKSTLLRLMMGWLEPDQGTISRVPGIRVNCLTQDPILSPGNTLEQEVQSAFTEINQLQAEETHLISQLEDLTGDKQIQALHRLDTIHKELERLDAREMASKISRMVTGLGFSEGDLQRRVAEFSGGWQMRINLAKLLLSGGDILLLDEPTNHLDLAACEWLEGFLREYPGGFLVVSHDRRFLDQVATEIAEVELGRLTLWAGNYSAYLLQKEDTLDRLTSAADRQQKELARQTAFVERFRASATKSTQAKSREKQLQKIERIEPPKTDTRQVSIRFPTPEPSGRQVLHLNNVSKAFGEKRLFQGVTVDLQRRRRVFLLGENGCGKTTLLRMIMELETPDTGEISLGHQVKPGYFSQNQLETLDPAVTVMNTLHEACPQLTHTEVRGLLGRFLFTGEQVFKPVSVLSGGEKSKLALARLMLSGPNFLLLDEPTNHMDIPAKQAMESAFLEYEGSMLCISHDRYFIQQLATEIWEIYEGRLIKYHGDYAYYQNKRGELRASVDAGKKRSEKKNIPAADPPAVLLPAETSPNLHLSGKNHIGLSGRERREAEKLVSKLEKSIIALEAELEELYAALEGSEIQQDYKALEALGILVAEKEQALQQLNEDWASWAEKL